MSMNNECIIVYESIYNGNSEKIARAMAHTLGCKYMKANEALNVDLSNYKTIGFGSGIYFGSHHPAVFEVVNKITQSEQDVFVFSSRGAPFLGKYHKPLKDLLVEKGMKVVGEFSVRGYDETGPWVIIGGGNVGKPNESDLKKASKFVRKYFPQYCTPDYYKRVALRQTIKEGFVNSYSIKTNNTQVELMGDFVSINQSVCRGCQKCVNICPLGVIELVNQKAVPLAELDCTLCKLCEMACDQRAINIHYTWIDAIKVAIRHAKRNSL